MLVPLKKVNGAIFRENVEIHMKSTTFQVYLCKSLFRRRCPPFFL